MSDNNTNSPFDSASGKSLSRARRAAMSSGGKSGLGQVKASSNAQSQGRSRPAVSNVNNLVEAVSASAPAYVAAVSSGFDSASGKALSRARRAGMSTAGKSGLEQTKTVASAKSQGRVRPSVAASMLASANTAAAELPKSECGCTGKDSAAKAERDNAIEEICSILDNEPELLIGSVASAARQLCQQRRQALSSRGKTAVKAFMKTAAQGSGLTGRAAARARRGALCENGRGTDPACRPAGRVRPQAAGKVQFGTTLSGNTVGGSQLDRNDKITGVAAGSCRAITGTEYIGAEQYAAVCASVPAAGMSKVAVGSTSRGQRVSGVDAERGQVTGTELDANKAVTGNEYLSVDKFESAAKTRPAPVKVGISSTRSGLGISGTEVGRSKKVTGDERGSCKNVSGVQYSGSEQFESFCDTTQQDAARSLMRGRGASTTRAGQDVSGSEVGRSKKVTGDEHGSCRAITGVQYASSEQFESFCDADQQAASRALMRGRGASTTRAGMDISGTEVGRSNKVTGDEHGSCQAISGIQYSGSEQFDSFCDATQQAASRALMVSRGARNVSGIGQASKGKITGAEKGAAMVLSGTPYQTSRQNVSQRGSNTNPHPLTRAPANIPREAPVVQQMSTQQGSFSVVTPARSSQQGNASRISGTAYESSGRITGPVGRATGLVSGTPEFRHQDNALAAMAPARAAEPQAESARNRVSGDGREGGRAITGAAWRRNEHVTGTEGNSTQRNQTIRGNQGSAMPGAAQMKVVERAELPISKITGSSGTDMKGSSITYSGGARG